MWVQRIDAKIAALTERQAQQERVRRARREPEWIVELGIGAGYREPLPSTASGRGRHATSRRSGILITPGMEL
ncbi:hypothetical protein [Streptomyces sp. NPDC047070]|uniref:hypothetical protein n=1 Tax=Streptomyces sp. NPDC047070 TaxID=3154923 RepID=UPI003455B582